MLRYLAATLLPAILLLSMASGAETANKPEIMRVNGAVQTPAQYSADNIAKTFAADVKVINYTLKGQPGKARVVPLIKLVMAAKPKVDAKQKNHLLAFTVLVRAADGYSASFSLGELQPEYGAAEVYIALDKDGQPLPADQQPVSLIVPKDGKPSRWVHGVTSITVIDALAAAGQ